MGMEYGGHKQGDELQAHACDARRCNQVYILTPSRCTLRDHVRTSSSTSMASTVWRLLLVLNRASHLSYTAQAPLTVINMCWGCKKAVVHVPTRDWRSMLV